MTRGALRGEAGDAASLRPTPRRSIMPSRILSILAVLAAVEARADANPAGETGPATEAVFELLQLASSRLSRSLSEKSARLREQTNEIGP